MNGLKVNSEKVSAVLFFIIAFIFPVMLDSYSIDNFSNFYITILVSLSLTLIWGFTGIFSFGQAVFYGFGAYTYAIISKAGKGGIWTIVGLVVAIIVSMIVAAIIGYFMFYGKISMAFTGIITMSLATVMELFMTQTSDGKWKILGIPLGGFNGVNKIPSIKLGTMKLRGTIFFIVVVVIVLLAYLIIKKMEKSNFGYSLFSIRENSVRSEMFGYNVPKCQTIVFSISAAFAGLAGALFASWSGYVVPSNFGVASSTIAVIMVAVAGRKNITGTIIMTWIYCWFTQKLATTGSQYSQLILGILLIVCMLFVSDGVMVAIYNWLDEKIFVKLKINKKAKTAK